MKKTLILLLSLSVKLGFSQLTSGLVACYPFDNNANDMTANGLNGSTSGVTSAVGHTGLSNTCYQFAGNSSSYIQLPASSLFQTPVVAVSGWYYSDNLGQAYLVYTKNNCSSNFEAYALNFLAPGSLGFGTGGFYVSKASSALSCSRVQLFQDLSVDPIPAAGDWTHVVFCIDDYNIYLYINGHLNTSVSHNITWDFATNPMKSVVLGNTMESFTQSFKGRIDNLRFYDRCLTASEVEYLYYRDPACDVNRRSGSPVGLAHHDFNNSDILSQNVPNPFANETTINYAVPASVGDASIEIYDMVGKKIAAYPLIKGESSLTITPGELAAGMYIYSIVGDGKVMASKRMVVTQR